MKITIESTTHKIELYKQGHGDELFIPARLWEGVTDSGIKVKAYIAVMSLYEGKKQSAEIIEEFKRELTNYIEPSTPISKRPLYFII